jgi:hypothetical protein
MSLKQPMSGCRSRVGRDSHVLWRILASWSTRWTTLDAFGGQKSNQPDAGLQQTSFWEEGEVAKG